MEILIGFAFLAGIFTALSPCILPVLPAILASGISGGRLRPLGTILGLICSFTFFTLTLTWLVQETGLSPYILRYIAIALIFFFGLVMIFPKLSNWFAALTAPIAGVGQTIHPSSGFLGGFIFGIALGLIWTPCAGPVLAAITTLVATHALDRTAILMTLAYSIGAAIPLFIIAYGSSKLIGLSRYSEVIRKFFGALMVLFSLMLLFNWDMMLNQQLSKIFPEFLKEKNLPLFGKATLMAGDKAPDFTGIDSWINKPSQLKGKVVLVDFWTYSCINCLRTLPYLKDWDAKYKDKGLVIVGVHTPEFEFEKDPQNVQSAVKELGINYPVALDNHYATWNAFHNHYWPAHYLIDPSGKIQMIHYGEGGYAETENGIRKLLGLKELEMKEPEQSTLATTPETYLGLARGRSYQMEIKPNQTFDYHYDGTLSEDQVGLKGAWRAENEFIEAAGNSYLELNFLAAQVYLVLAGSSDEPLTIMLDGKPHGQITVDGDKKYDIVSAPYGRHTLSLKVPKGVKAYAFTFGSTP